MTYNQMCYHRNFKIGGATLKNTLADWALISMNRLLKRSRVMSCWRAQKKSICITSRRALKLMTLTTMTSTGLGQNLTTTCCSLTPMMIMMDLLNWNLLIHPFTMKLTWYLNWNQKHKTLLREKRERQGSEEEHEGVKSQVDVWLRRTIRWGKWE